MATIIIRRPTLSQPSYQQYTTGSDYIRGGGASELLGYALGPLEQSFIDLYKDFFDLDLNEARDDFFLGVGPQFGGPAPDYSLFLGNDRIYGRGGDDYIVDLLGDNYVVTDEGNDRILLGNGNDRIYDQGGDNVIDILGGNNTITTRDGNDTINTGDGLDNINAFDGRNIIDAGEGNNIVRGGDDFDEIRVGTGDDFIDVRGGFLGDQDLNGDGIADTGYDKNFDGFIDPPDVAQIEFFDPFFTPGVDPIISGAFHNLVVDAGGNDNIRSTAPGSRQGDDFILSDVVVDTTVANGVTTITVSNVINVGDDVIDVGAGNNFIFDAGGDTTVRTLQGNDTVFTSYYALATGVAGDDDIDTGAGSDFINPGAGSDVVRPGPGDDFIVLENDGDADTIVYRAGVDGRVGDEVPVSGGNIVAAALATDIVTGFDIVGGVDKIDMRAYDVTFDDLLFYPLFTQNIGLNVEGAGPDLLLLWDANGNGGFDAQDFLTTIIADVSSLLTEDNFIFADDMAIV